MKDSLEWNKAAGIVLVCQDTQDKMKRCGISGKQVPFTTREGVDSVSGTGVVKCAATQAEQNTGLGRTE